MAPSSNYCLRLGREPLVFGIVIALVFPATWLLERFELLDVSGIAWNSLWTVFVFGFVSPFCLLLLYLLWSRPPIIRLSDKKLFLRHVTIPWHNTELPLADVNWVVAEWEPGTSYCFLKIKVTPSCFHRECLRNRWLHGKDGFLKMADDYFDVANRCELDGRWAEANDNYERALELKPDLVEAYDNRAGNWVELRDYGRAIADYHQVIDHWPHYSDAHNNLASIYLDAEDEEYVNPKLALTHAQKACKLTGNNCYESLATCARAYHACQIFGKAVYFQQLAVNVASRIKIDAEERIDQINAEMILPNLEEALERFLADKAAHGERNPLLVGHLLSMFTSSRPGKDRTR